MGPVARQVDYHQAIQSILCCAYITTITVIFITREATRVLSGSSTAKRKDRGKDCGKVGNNAAVIPKIGIETTCKDAKRL